MTVVSIYRYGFTPNPTTASASNATLRLILSQPSPIENKTSWPRRYLSRNSTETRSNLGEIEPFGISRESFDSYRRSFVCAKLILTLLTRMRFATSC